MTTPTDTILDALAVSPAGLTQTQLISVLRRSGHRLEGRPLSGASLERFIADIDEVQRDGRYPPASRGPRPAWRGR